MIDILLNIIYAIFGCIFGVCMLFLSTLAEITGLTYHEVAVYFNLYLQGGILVLSTLPILYYAIKNVIKKISAKSVIVTLCAILYVALFAYGYVEMYQHYTLDINYAFTTCQNELMALGKLIPLNLELPYCRGDWTNYYIVNVIIFIVGFLGVLGINIFATKKLKKIYKKAVSKISNNPSGTSSQLP